MVNLLALPIVVIGLVLAMWPARVARLNEQLDAIGSHRSVFAVEPAGWAVSLVRVFGLLVAFVGVGLVLSA